MRANRGAAQARRDGAGTGPGRRGPRQAWDIYLVVGAGGALGGVARWGVGQAWPTPPDGIAWSTLLVNATGCFLLGGLAVWLAEVAPGRYLRPFLAVGVLGGYTTFSTYTVQIRSLLATGHPARAFSYALGSLAAGMIAVSAGVLVARLLARRPIRHPARGRSEQSGRPDGTGRARAGKEATGDNTTGTTRIGLPADRVRR